jgi:hypothetical protein
MKRVISGRVDTVLFSPSPEVSQEEVQKNPGWGLLSKHTAGYKKFTDPA